MDTKTPQLAQTEKSPSPVKKVLDVGRGVLWIASMIVVVIWAGSEGDAPLWFDVVGIGAAVIYTGEIVLYLIAGWRFQDKTGIRLKMGYGGW